MFGMETQCFDRPKKVMNSGDMSPEFSNLENEKHNEKIRHQMEWNGIAHEMVNQGMQMKKKAVEHRMMVMWEARVRATAYPGKRGEEL